MTGQPSTAPTWVRSYALRGRKSALTLERMGRLYGRREVPPGSLFRGVFGRDAPLVLEVGCGHGAAAITYARTHPGHDVVAVDVHLPGIARMLARAEDEGVANLRTWMGDATALLDARVVPASLHAVHLFFPDPWPKARHAKRRWVTPLTLGLVHRALEPDGILRIATDREDYADHVRGELAAFGGFDVREGERPAWRPTEGFEAKGLAAGRSIVEMCARRVSG